VPYYEVITEPGTSMVMEAENDETALRGIKEHHARATRGEAGGPTGHPAERVKRVLVYDEHPGSYGRSQAFSKDEVTATLKEIEGDVIYVPELIQKLRDMTSPLTATPPHESSFKMEQVRELKAKNWGGE
jgi:hypothetical protein